ncbi:acireductone synthase [Streptomyces sp. R-74717]|uniref:acireductone synthase n=1 Tax=Streptomyces sp. R-74717 TaxID=2969820 RepID=UPI0039B6E64C
MTNLRADAVVLDIEGTIGSLTHVRDVLFPYARRRLADWFGRHRDDPRLEALLHAVREEAGRPELDETGALAVLVAWSDADVKAAPLKTVQGWIWAEGYAEGDLHGHVYSEVPSVLRRWRADGMRVFTYSSGSAKAQLDWFGHTAYGDLTGLLDDRFDLENAGPKNDPGSYRRIGLMIGGSAVPPVFLSDTAYELDAAAAAGWTGVGVRRDDDPRGTEVPGHVTVTALDRLHLGPAPAATRAHDQTVGEVFFS